MKNISEYSGPYFVVLTNKANPVFMPKETVKIEKIDGNTVLYIRQGTFVKKRFWFEFQSQGSRFSWSQHLVKEILDKNKKVLWRNPMHE